MTFQTYIQRQKSLIRSRRGEETYSVRESEEIDSEYDTEKLIEDLASLKGLNTAERRRYSEIFSCV